MNGEWERGWRRGTSEGGKGQAGTENQPAKLIREGGREKDEGKS